MKNLFFLQASLLFLFVSFSSVFGNNDPREVIVENNNDWFKIKTKLKDEEGLLQKFDTNVHQFLGPSGMIELFLSAFSKDDDSKEKIEYKVRFYDIVEFTESATGSDGYEPGVDTLIQTYAVSAWNPFTSEPADENGIIRFECSSVDQVVKFVGYVDGEMSNLVIGNQSFELSPDEVKFDMDIDFTELYEQADSKLAIRARVRSGKKIAGVDGGDFTSISIEGDDGSSGAFSWIPEVVDGGGANVEVITSTPQEISNSDESELEMFFTFNSVEQTVFSWDPIVKISSASFFGPSVVAILAVVLAIMV